MNNVADYLFILKPTTNKTVVGENTYYQYEVLFDGEKTTKYIEQSIVGADAQGVMVYNVKANDKDYITSATTFVDKTTSGAKNIHEVTDMDIANNGKLTQSGKTISVTGDINRAYIVDNDTNIYLVYGQNCELRKDNGAKYELYSNLSASGLAGRVKGYELDGLVYAVVDDQGSDVLDYLYVYVEHAKETAPQVDPDILGVTFMGLTPGASGETGVDGKVTVSDSVNKSGKVRLQVNVAGGGDGGADTGGHRIWKL